ncbi:MAG TPA: hypothetical protein VIL86_08510 [Tepidisphaeraceae bacterium]|jgi:hypothetical protein
MMRINPNNIEIVDDEMAAVLKSKTGAERLAIASDMYEFARENLLSQLRHAHPDWSDLRVNYEAVRRLSHGAI